MFNKIAHLLRNWKLVIRTILIAVFLGGVFAKLLELFPIPICLYVGLLVSCLILAVWADRWFVWCYKKTVQHPIFLVENIDYSNLRRQGRFIMHLKLSSKSSVKIKTLEVRVKYNSVIFNTIEEIDSTSLKVDRKITAGISEILAIPFKTGSEPFQNDALAASRMGREFPLSLSFRWEVNPIWWRLVIPENIPYSETLDYDKSPESVF